MTPEQKTAVLSLIAEGSSARAACRDNGITWGRFNEAVQDDPEFAGQYARATKIRADGQLEEIHEIADAPLEDGQTTSSGVQIASTLDQRRLQIDTRKWSMARMNARKYGEKLALGGADDLPPVKAAIDVTKLSTDAMAEILAAMGNAAPETDTGRSDGD